MQQRDAFRSLRPNRVRAIIDFGCTDLERLFRTAEWQVPRDIEIVALVLVPETDWRIWGSIKHTKGLTRKRRKRYVLLRQRLTRFNLKVRRVD